MAGLGRLRQLRQLPRLPSRGDRSRIQGLAPAATFLNPLAGSRNHQRRSANDSDVEEWRQRCRASRPSLSSVQTFARLSDMSHEWQH
jgi:hypothetical protein